LNAPALEYSVALVGTAGAIGFFLPSLDKAWAANPEEVSLTHLHLRSSEKLYVIVVLSVAVGQSIAAKSILPLIVGAAICAAVITMYERALAQKVEG
jgi:hypothetical protein